MNIPDYTDCCKELSEDRATATRGVLVETGAGSQFEPREDGRLISLSVPGDLPMLVSENDAFDLLKALTNVLL